MIESQRHSYHLVDPSSSSLGKRLHIFFLITFAYFLLFYLLKEVPGIFFMKNIISSLGGASALAYVFLADNFISRVSTLYSFFMSSFVLFISQSSLDFDLTIIVLLSLSVSFFCSFFFCEKRDFFPFFLVAFLLFSTLIDGEWRISFLIEFLILFGFMFLENPFHLQRTKKILFSFCMLIVPCFYLYFLELPKMSLNEIFFFASAGAGGLQFLCLNKTEQGQVNGFYFYVLSNVILGFLLKKEGETFPRITLVFLLTICAFFIFVFLVSRFKEQSLSSVISHSKTFLRGVFFPILYVLDSVFLNNLYCLWVSSFCIHVFILFLFKFIFLTEESPLKKNEEKG